MEAIILGGLMLVLFVGGYYIMKKIDIFLVDLEGKNEENR